MCPPVLRSRDAQVYGNRESSTASTRSWGCGDIRERSTGTVWDQGGGVRGRLSLVCSTHTGEVFGGGSRRQLPTHPCALHFRGQRLAERLEDARGSAEAHSDAIFVAIFACLGRNVEQHDPPAVSGMESCATRAVPGRVVPTGGEGRSFGMNRMKFFQGKREEVRPSCST